MKETLTLGTKFDVTYHAAIRFLSRILKNKNYRENEINIVKLILKRELSNRVFDIVYRDDEIIKFVYKNACFYYNNKKIVTVYYNKENVDKIFEYKYYISSDSRFSDGVVKKYANKLNLKNLKNKLEYNGFIPVKNRRNIIYGIYNQYLITYRCNRKEIIRVEFNGNSDKYLKQEKSKEV